MNKNNFRLLSISSNTQYSPRSPCSPRSPRYSRYSNFCRSEIKEKTKIMN